MGSAVGQESGSTPLEREARAQARAAADSLIDLPGADFDAALPAATRSCKRSAGVAGTAMFADRQSPTNVDGAIAVMRYGDRVVWATGAVARRSFHNRHSNLKEDWRWAGRSVRNWANVSTEDL